MKKVIVVGVDGSAGSQRAMNWALDEAALRKSELRLVNAWSYPPVVGYEPIDPSLLTDASTAVLEKAVAEARGAAPDVEITGLSADGGAVSALVDASKEADLLVVGSRGHGGFANLLLGSVSQQCAQHSHCPVVIVPDHATDG